MLDEYAKKRDFSKTPEPKGKRVENEARHPIFVIQKHAARRLHYDFRIEFDGVLVSWAVPKGPSLNPDDKRLAVKVEDHPFEYKDFEGTIPDGEYGSGPVIVWDRGFYGPEGWNGDTNDMETANRLIREGLEKGKLTLILYGEKIKGSWALVKIKKEDNQWLLIKHRDEYARNDEDITELDSSVLSGKTLRDIEKEGARAVTQKKKSAQPKKSSDSASGAEKTRSNRPRGEYELKLTEQSELDILIEKLDKAGKNAQLEVGAHELSFSNLDKELWPAGDGEEAVTKRDYVRYLLQVSNYVLPHLFERPLTLIRYPNGIKGKSFFQKHWEHELPHFVDTVMLFSEHNKSDGEYFLCNNLPTLLWLGQLADLELHTTHTRLDPEPDGHDLPRTFTGSVEAIEASLMNHPDYVVLDLDPYIYSGKEAKGAEPELNKQAFKKVCEIALDLRATLQQLKLDPFVKTSGRTGLHIYLPVVRNIEYDMVRAVAETIGRHLLAKRPDDITMDWAVVKRKGKIFFDHNMNGRGKTLPAPYSARNSMGAGVSTPLQWSELNDVYPTDFNIRTVPKRLSEMGDIWSDILEHKSDLTKLPGLSSSTAKQLKENKPKRSRTK